MKIVISGYYGSGNAGDEAMLDAILQLLRELNPNIEVTVISVNPSDTRTRHNVNSIPHLNLFAVTKEIFSADLLISGGGSLLQNVTSWRSLYYYLGVITLAIFLRRRVMLFAQGIGPIFGNFARGLTTFVLNRVDLITVRDRGSLVELSRLKVFKPRIECTADPVLALRPVSLDFGHEILSNLNKDIHIGVAVRHWQDFKNFKLQLATALDNLCEEINAQIIFIPMQPSFDVTAAEEVAAAMKNSCTLLRDKYTTNQLLSIVGCMDILIGVRLHALIFAGVMKVPMVGISYDPKIDRFLDSIGEVPVGGIDSLDSDQLVNAVMRNIHKIEEESVAVDMSDLRELAKKSAILALDLIKTS